MIRLCRPLPRTLLASENANGICTPSSIKMPAPMPDRADSNAVKAHRTTIPSLRRARAGKTCGVIISQSRTLACGVALAAHGFGATAREEWTSSRVIGSPNPPAPYAVEQMYPAQSFQSPVGHSPSCPARHDYSSRNRAGRCGRSTRARTARRINVAIDLRKHHQPFDSILGFTFHPGFATNRFIFINYNEPGGRGRGAHVSRFTLASLNPPVIDPQSERVIIRWISGGHNGCTLAFGNDGMLYISTGDNDDPIRRTEEEDRTRHQRLLASILRIDVDHIEGTNNYSIPRDNPFIRTLGARPEEAFGLRNPFRMAFDRVSGDLLVADVGFEQWEMIYRVKSGGNYGWSITEGPNTDVPGRT